MGGGVGSEASMDSAVGEGGEAVTGLEVEREKAREKEEKVRLW